MEEKEITTQRVHPAMRAPRPRRRGGKMRRTIVRTAKLVNPFVSPAVMVEVPIEMSHNNRGTLTDPTIPLRHYLEKGFVFPHEFQGKVMVDGKAVETGRIYCAVSGCWKPALADADPEGSERCAEHEGAWARGEIRYAVLGER